MAADCSAGRLNWLSRSIPDAAGAVQAAERMIRTHGVIALIGPNRSTHAVKVGAVAQRERLPMITTSATNPDVTEAGNFVFMAAFTDRFQGLVLARFAREDLGLTSVAVLTLRDDVYTEGISEFFTSRFTGIGGTVVANVFYDSGATDFADQLARIAAAKPEAFFISGLAPEVALVARQARAVSIQNASGQPSIFQAPTRGTIRRFSTMPPLSWKAAFSAVTFHPTRTRRAHARLSMHTNPRSEPRLRVETL